MAARYRARQSIGKYRIVRRLAVGPLADVYEGFDTVQQLRVALKLPHAATGVLDDVSDFVSEARIASKLKHPNILPVLNAAFIGDQFVIAMPLGVESLAERIERRMANVLAMDYALQSLRALAHAHEHNVIHCDIKPENFILFPEQVLRLADFGFAKVSARTIKGSGSGTIDYIAPEQALGKPRKASDVFSLGLVLYRLFAGVRPEYPFDWPPPAHDRLVARTNPAFADVVRRAIEPDPKRRFPDAGTMLAAAMQADSGARRQRVPPPAANVDKTPTWRRSSWKAFRRNYSRHLDLKASCRHCEGPVAMEMQACPWCGTENPAAGEARGMPAHCPRCERGVKLDWNYCAWCYGAGFEPEGTRRYPDKRYTARCANSRCREPLMPHMRYCPWCRTKVKRRWALSPGDPSCKTCGQAVAAGYWRFCAWCREPLDGSAPAARKRGSA